MMVALGGFSGPWAYKGSQAAQGYPDGQIATLSLFCASILAYTCLWQVKPNSISQMFCMTRYLATRSMDKAFTNADGVNS